MGAAEPDLINELIRSSPLYSKYGQMIDRESAYEILKGQQEAASRQQQASQQQAASQRQTAEPQCGTVRVGKPVSTIPKQAKPVSAAKKTAAAPRKTTVRRTVSSPVNKALSSAMTQIGREAGRALARGLFGTMKKR